MIGGISQYKWCRYDMIPHNSEHMTIISTSYNTSLEKLRVLVMDTNGFNTYTWKNIIPMEYIDNERG